MAETQTDKPTKSQIQAMLLRRKTRLYAQLRAEQDKDMRYYEGTDDLGFTPEAKKAGYHEVRTGTGRALIEVVTRRLLGIPKDESAPRKNEKIWIERNTKRKMFINAFIAAHRQEVKATFKKELILGEGWFRVLLDESRWGTEPVRKEGESEEAFKDRQDLWELGCIENFPIDFSSPDPRNLYPSLDKVHGVPRDLIVEFPRTAGDVRARFPNWGKTNTKKDDTNVQWVEFWSPNWRAYWADWEPILVSGTYADGIIPNIWGFVPYVHILGGFGIEDKEGKPETLARSLIYNFRGRLTAYQRAVSFQDSDSALHAHRTGKVVVATEQEIQAGKDYAETISTAPGNIRVETIDGPHFEMDEVGKLNQMLFSQSASLNANIEQEAHIALLSGYAPKNVTSGLHQGMALSWARSDYEEAIKNLEDGLARAIGMVLRLIETKLKKSVTMRATVVEKEQETQKDVVLKPEEIAGHYTVRVRFQAEDPSRADMLSMQGLSLVQAEVISAETNLGKYQGFDDPRAEIIKIGAERYIRESNLLRASMDREAARLWGLSDQEIEQAEQQRMMKEMAASPMLFGPNGQPMSSAQRAGDLPVRRNERGMGNASTGGGTVEFPVERTGALRG